MPAPSQSTISARISSTICVRRTRAEDAALCVKCSAAHVIHRRADVDDPYTGRERLDAEIGVDVNLGVAIHLVEAPKAVGRVTVKQQEIP